MKDMPLNMKTRVDFDNKSFIMSSIYLKIKLNFDVHHMFVSATSRYVASKNI